MLADEVIELGIDFSHIFKKILVVINPWKVIDEPLINDADLVGPIIFCFILSLFLLLVNFSIWFDFRRDASSSDTHLDISSQDVLLCASVHCLQHSYILLKLLSDSSSNNVSLTSVMSILGYSMIPLLFLSMFSVVFPVRSFFVVPLTSRTVVGWIVAVVCILWASFSASRFIESLLKSNDQRYIIMYPLVLLYAVFALITVFWFYVY